MMLKTVTLTLLALLAFAANSILARQAIGLELIDPASFTGVRLVSGAVVLAVLVMLSGKVGWRAIAGLGTAGQAAALFGYAVSFSFAYVLLGAGMGALVLFVSVQFGIIARALVAGDRPGALEWLGLAIALGAFVYLVSPGLAAPDPLGTILMVAAGLCWAAYTLMARGSTRPLADAAGSFVRCVPFCLLLLGFGLSRNVPSGEGLMLAIASGAITSGIGYAIWYAVLPSLTRTRAAIVQLSVPAIAAAIALPVLGESLTARLVIASFAILGGIAVAILGAERRRSA